MWRCGATKVLRAIERPLLSHRTSPPLPRSRRLPSVPIGMLWRILISLLSLLVMGSTAAWALDRYGQREPPEETFDAIVVLGCRVQADGTPSTALRERTRRAVELWREGRAPVIILTGGVGEHPPSEARAAADVARALGVPESALLLEERSRSTAENARFAAEKFDGRRILLVSDAYHVFRAERVFSHYYEHVRGTGTLTRFDSRLHGAVREVAACVIYWGLGRMGLGMSEPETPSREIPATCASCQRRDRVIELSCLGQVPALRRRRRNRSAAAGFLSRGLPVS